MLVQALPIVRDMRTVMTNRFESSHSINKQKIRTVHCTVGSAPENFAIAEHVSTNSIRFLLEEGKWGPLLEHEGGSGIRAIVQASKLSSKSSSIFRDVRRILDEVRLS